MWLDRKRYHRGRRGSFPTPCDVRVPTRVIRIVQAHHASIVNRHLSSWRSSVPATILRFCRKTRKSNRSMTHGTTMNGAFEVAGGSLRRFNNIHRHLRLQMPAITYTMHVISFSGLLELTKQQHMQGAERVLGWAPTRRPTTVVNCAQYRSDCIPCVGVHHAATGE